MALPRSPDRFGGAPAAAIKASKTVDLPLPWGPTRAIERGPATAFEEELVMMALPFLHPGRRLARLGEGRTALHGQRIPAFVDLRQSLIA
jgi:hypothetical protein